MANEEQKTNGQPQGKPVDTPAFVKSVLGKLGCTYEENPENKLEFTTTYNNEKFAIRAMEGYPFIRIHDMWWYSVDLDDMEEIERVRRTINEINAAMPGYTVVFSVSQPEKMIGVHTMAEVLMIEPIPNTEGYLQRIFDGFLQQKNNFSQCLEAVRKAEADAKAKAAAN